MGTAYRRQVVRVHVRVDDQKLIVQASREEDPQYPAPFAS